MKLEGNYTLEAPQDVVWEALQDPEVLARIMPGCERLEAIGDDQYEGTLKIKVGPVQGVFNGQITLSDFDPPNGYRLALNGTGPQGFVNGTGEIRLVGQGEETELAYTGDAQVGGRIASVGQRLLDRSARALTQQSLEGLNRQLVARQAPPPAATTEEMTAATHSPPPQAPEAPSQTEFALGVARTMLEDLTPEDGSQRVVLGGVGVVVGWLVIRAFLNAFANRVARRVAVILREEMDGR